MAGYKYYHFPSQTGYYTLNSGQYRITLKAYDASFPGDGHEDVNLQMLKLGNLIYEFETDAKDQKSRFGRFDVEFFNKCIQLVFQFFLDRMNFVGNCALAGLNTKGAFVYFLDFRVLEMGLWSDMGMLRRPVAFTCKIVAGKAHF